MTPTRCFAALFAVLFFTAVSARADWSGTLKIHNDPASQNEPDLAGTLAGSGMKMRVDAERPGVGKTAFIIDLKQHKGIMIMDARQAFMTMDLDQAQGRSPLAGLRCDEGDASACLTKIGFAKTGTEKVNGKKSDRWEIDRADPRGGGKVHETLWVPQGVKGFALVRQVTKSATRTMTLDVIDFKEGPVSPEQFDAPTGYTDMTGHGGPMGPPGAHGHP